MSGDERKKKKKRVGDGEGRLIRVVYMITAINVLIWREISMKQSVGKCKQINF